MLKYKLLEDYINIWIKSKKIHGLLVEGPVGTGKTHQLERILKQKKKKYILINTHITPLSLYITLYTFKDEFIVVDDVLKLFKDKTTSGLLIAALQSKERDRLVSYYTTSEKLGDIPNHFNFKGKIAILCNKLPANLDHLKSRCYHLILEFSYKEIIAILKEVSKNLGYPQELVKFIKENTDETTSKEILNIRLLLKLNSIYQEFPNKWKELGVYLIKKDTNLYILKHILDKYNNIREQIKMYKKLTGRGRSSFYRDKKKLL